MQLPIWSEWSWPRSFPFHWSSRVFKRWLCTHYLFDHIYYKYDRSLWCKYCLSLFNISPMINKKLKKLDHAMIFVLIAGSYTPICTIVLGGTLGYGLLSVIWIIAILGIVFKMFWVTCPKWYLLSCISQWDGFVSLRSHRSSIVYPRHLWMAACWRYHLYSWWCDLCTKDSLVRKSLEEFWSAWDLSSVCYGWKFMPYDPNVPDLIFAPVGSFY